MHRFLLILGVCATPLLSLGDWPHWRGPSQNGDVPSGTAPVEWSETKNVRWKKTIPGFGSSTPVIWKNQLFITSATPTGRTDPGSRFEVHQYLTLCYDKATGEVLWQRISKEEAPHEGHHRDHGYASMSCVTDGRYLLSYFGSRGLFCYDLQGKLLWEKDLGDMSTRNGFGEGSSPALAGDTVLLCWDHEGDSFMYGLDVKTGRERWKQPRPERTSWSTPLIINRPQPMAIVNGTERVRAYDIQSGKVIWEAGGQTVNAIPSVVADDSFAYAMSGFRGAALHAIRLDSKGDVTGTPQVVWKHEKGTPYVPSPLLSKGRLYFFSGNSGIFSIFEAKTGKPLVEMERIPGLTGVYASPIAVENRLYLVGRDGKTVVLKQADSVEVLATNSLDDRFDASPVVSGNALYLRGHSNLYCLSQD